MTKLLRQTDPQFHIVDKFTITSRAAVEISKDCPDNYFQVLQTCMNRGWIKPVAYVTDDEYMIMKLTH
jgi:hypothetical protein